MTRASIIPAEDLPFIEAVSSLMVCNPFVPERIALERKALGSDYTKLDHPWNAHIDSFEDNPNIGSLVGRLEQVAHRLRRVLSRRGRISGADAELYKNLVYFLLYYRTRDALSRQIALSHSGEHPKGRVRIYDDFCEQARELLCVGRTDLGIQFPASHLFAISFQVRRAFDYIFRSIVGTSAAAMRLRAQVWESIFTHGMLRYVRVLHNRMGDIITLITGDSGTGKELVARAIAFSRYIPFDEQEGKFVEDFTEGFYPLNLSALSPTLIESELFGHCKGAFTGAMKERTGHFEKCGQSGSVFLDEIADVNPSIQLKLLRVLQTRRFQRVGDNREQTFRGKIIVATNRDVCQELKSGRLRADFYYRLCADRIETPSLRDILAEDPDELLYLVRHVSKQVTGEDEAESLAREVCNWVARDLSPAYSWPGNFRELEQCVRNILVHGEYNPEHTQSCGFLDEIQAGSLTVEELLRRYVTSVYERTSSYQETARILDVDPRTVKKYVNPDSPAAPAHRSDDLEARM